MAQKTWGGRFDGPTDALVEQFTESISADRRLYRQDIRASAAHAEMLAEVGLMTAEECRRVLAGLEEIRGEIEAGRFDFTPALEDIHTHVESALIARVGDAGRKLHTARSRNDQVVTAVKLWVRDAAGQVDGLLAGLQRAFLAQAEREAETVMPGYTHLQRAQPVLAAHYFLAYVEKFQRDRGRLADALERANLLPLGSAAVAGTSLPIDRESVRRKLGFGGLCMNSVDVSCDRDFLLEFTFALAAVAVHLSGWAEEWVLWSTTEFGFLELPDGFCTGSSIMPHKRNPDVLELIRGRSARVIAAQQQLMILTKGLPTAYNRDLQEDKPALFAAYDAVEGMLRVAAPLAGQARLRREAIAARLEDGFLDATTLMEFFVSAGVPMRSAHEAVGRLVRRCEAEGRRLADLPDEALEEVCPGRSADARRVLGVRNALAAFRGPGSTAPDQVRGQIGAWRARLGQ